MHKEGHVGIGLLLFSPIAFLTFELGLAEVFALGMVAMAVWSFLPDIDMQLPIRHRGPTHSFVAAGIAGLLTAFIAVYFATQGTGRGSDLVINSPILAHLAAAGFGFSIGVLGVVSHLLGDVLTPMGIQPFWPYSSKEYSIGLVLAADKQANERLSLIGGATLVLAIVATEFV